MRLVKMLGLLACGLMAMGSACTPGIRETDETRTRDARIDAEIKAEHRCDLNYDEKPSKLPVDCLEKKLCENYSEIDGLKNSNAYERHIGQKAGYVNAGKIYTNTKDLEVVQYEAKQYSAAYKQKTGKKFDPRKCPKGTAQN